MKYLIWSCIMMCLIACSNETSFQVLQNSCEAKMNNQILVSGDIINERIVAEKPGELIIENLANDELSILQAPFRLSSEDILKKIEGQSFSKQYMSFILDNIQKDARQIDIAYHGGVARSNPQMPIKNKEQWIENVVLTLSNKEAFTLSLEDESGKMVYRESKVSHEIVLDSLPDNSSTKAYFWAIKSPFGQGKGTVYVPSKKERDALENQVQNLVQKNMPAYAMLNFYLKEKWYSKARILIKEMLNKQPENKFLKAWKESLY